jgi:hypothetical protein
MKEYVICKSCGYVMEKGKLKDSCPACGVPAKMFEPYVERLSPRRKLLLSLDLHPIVVHFTQAFAVTLPLLCLFSLFVTGVVRATVLSAVRVLSCLLPLAVAAAVPAGMLDGKVRFRKVTTGILVRKIMLGSLFFLLSVANLAVVLVMGIDAGPGIYIVIGLTLCCVAAASVLGRFGAGLLNARFPG